MASKVVWAGRGISGLVSAAFVMSGVMKLVGGEKVTEGIAPLGLTESMIVPLAILELACVGLYLLPMTSVLGAILLAGYMGGAILAHWRVGDPVFVQIGLGVAVWLGVWLRDGRIRALIPFRRAGEA